MTAAVRVLVPLQITAAMLSAGTSIAEPDLARGEVAWVSGGTYAIDDLRTYGGSVWSCVKAHAGRTTPPATEVAGYWLRKGPSNRMAAFDDYTTTPARAATSLTLVLRPGFFNGLRLDGLVGSAMTATLRDGTGGPVLWTWTGELWEQAIGLYELLFQPLRQLKTLSFDNLPLCPDPELTITITSTAGAAVAVGTVMVGDWRPLIGNAKWGGVGYGASAQRKSYTYWDEKPDGTFDILRRPARRDVQCQVEFDADEAMYADALLEEILDRMVAFEGSDLPRYGYLNTAGFVSASITPVSYAQARLDLNIKGSI